MRCALRLSAILLPMLVLSPQANAWTGGGGGFSGGFFGGFRGFSGRLAQVAPSGHFANRFHGQSFLHRQFFGAQRLDAFRFRREQAFAPTGVLFGGDWWWPDMGQAEAYAPPPDAPVQPEVIFIQSDNKQPRVAEATPDYGYIAGCHAIPNGYHCDTSGAAGSLGGITGGRAERAAP